MNFMEIALLGLLSAGFFFMWFGGVNIFVSKKQLRKPIEYGAIRQKADQKLLKIVESRTIIQQQVRKWNTWSEIGTGQTFSLATYGSRAVSISFSFVLLAWLFTNSLLMMLIGSLIGFLIPFLLLKARFLHVVHRARRMGLLPFIDVYKNAYIAGPQNVITAFHDSEPDCPKEMRPVLDWLLRRLHDGSPQREGLREFATILHSESAQVFVNYCISGLEGEAENISRSLSQLQIEMHGMRDEEEDRDVITRSAFYANFFIIGLTLLGIFFISLLLPQIKRYFVQQNEGHILLTVAIWTWLTTIIYNYLRMKGGDT